MTNQVSAFEFGTVVEDGDGVEVASEDVSRGLAADDLGVPRPELDGLRVRIPGRTEIYLMDQGFRHWIPDNETYNNLFRDRNGIREELSVADLPIGTAVAGGSVLVRGIGTSPVYLFDGGVKRWVSSNAAMDKYHFSFKGVFNVPIILLRNVPGGPDINA